MRWNTILFVVACLAVLSFAVPVHTQPLHGYEKILVIQLDYDNGVYHEESQYIRYGQGPNLNIMSGNLRAVISDVNDKEIKSFFVMEPGIATGDSIGTTEGGIPNLKEYLELSGSDEIVLTIPYKPDMQVLRLYDAQGNTPIISVDLTVSPSVFCADYPADPDCIQLNLQSRRPAPDTNIPAFYFSIFVVLIVIAATTAFIFKRRKTVSEILRKKRVLIVDDEPDLVELVRLLLEKQGYQSMSAPGGKECLDLIRQKKNIPDVILLDIMMKPMDGWETLEQIKTNPETKDIPVLMLTGKQLTAAEAKQYHVCIEDYIMKPFEKVQLYSAIEHVLIRKKNISENVSIAKKAGVAQETFCEYAKLSRHVDVNKKLIGLLQQAYGMQSINDLKDGEEYRIIEHMIINTRYSEDRLEQIQREIFSAFTAKGYPVPVW
ncbi:MAG: response regulator [Methanoregula sp.]|nr:MAG: response regulator [Methanoregula sp.]